MNNIEEAHPNERLLTPANVVTLVRICLVPVFVVALISPWPEWLGLPSLASHLKEIIAAAIFVIISATDWLDGYLARSRNEVTDFGKFMDPLADKILVVAALLALVELGSLPSWVAIIIVAREFIVSGVRMMAASEGIVIAASWYGKFKTVFQMIAIVLFVVKGSYMVGTFAEALSDGLWVISWIVMIIALVLTVVSMLDYIAKARDIIGLGSLGRGGRAGGVSGRRPADAQAAQRPGKAGTAGAGMTAEELCGSDIEIDEAVFRAASSVIDSARAAHATIGTAESLTGGLIAGSLTAVPGSSDVVRGGIVSYAPAVKASELGVPAQVIDTFGVVSEETASAMARGALSALACDAAVAVTGIAGPGGAEPGKPVGTVWIAAATHATLTTKLFVFEGDRASVRSQTVLAALALLESEASKL